MPNSGSEGAASVEKQDTASLSKKLSSTKQRISSPASAACPSFRIYYYDGAAGSIPFEWETHPGTPKHPSSDLPPLPPLTPPPSHFSFSTNHFHTGSKRSTKKMKISALLPTKLFCLTGCHVNKVKKLSASSPPSMSERVLIDENEYDLFKIQTERKVMPRFSSFDASVPHYPIRRSQSTSCFGIPRCFIC